MKIGNLIVHLLKENESFMVLPRPLSKVDIQRINQYVGGGFHWVRRNHGPRKKAPRPDVEDIGRIVHVPDPIAKEEGL